MQLTPEQLAAIAEAFGLPADAAYEDIIAAVSAWLKQVQDAANGNAPAPAADGAEPEDQVGDPAAMNIVKRIGQVYALALHKRGSDKELTALRSNLLRETDRATTTEAFSVLATWKASHLTLAEKQRQLDTERSALEMSDRLTLVKELVTIGAETPATAYGKDGEGVTDATKPSAFFTRMTLAELREHVAAKKAAAKAGNGGTRPPETPRPPVSAAGDVTVHVDGKAVTLSAHDQKFCKDNGVTHEARARAKLRLAR
jgi:hypothetical protein